MSPLTIQTIEALRALAKSMLTESFALAYTDGDPGRWTLQGFGMLRRHLPDDWRLNVWDSAFRVPDVSRLHDHPWNFESVVLSGELLNVRHSVEPALTSHDATHAWAQLKPGPGGGLLGQIGSGRERGELGLARLVPQPAERYARGQVYSQLRDEVHVSDPSDGCVTLNRRFDRLERDVARVFWPCGTSWVSAEPRQATAAEVREALGRALERWDR